MEVRSQKSSHREERGAALERESGNQLDVDTLARLQAYFTNEVRVPAAYLFGSRASGAFAEDSDVDVAVILGPGLDAEQAFWECANMKDALEVAFRPVRVDVLDLERIPCRIAHEVLKMAKLVAQNDEGRRVEVESRRRSEYLDFLPRLIYYRKAVLGLDWQREEPREAR
jgi:predicted nucleotidyltransferase